MEAGQYVFDLNRIFLGRLPWEYLLEVLFRCAIIYIYALFVVRMLGKRGMGQLAPFDFVIIIALGSAVGDPMFYPDVPRCTASSPSPPSCFSPACSCT